jgi:hypothetical protein
MVRQEYEGDALMLKMIKYSLFVKTLKYSDSDVEAGGTEPCQQCRDPEPGV